MKEKELIGKLIKGFKFAGFPRYLPFMEQYDDVIGEIIWLDSTIVTIKFPNGKRYNYPYSEALKHIVEEEKEQSIEEILNNIKNLTKQI
jgi:hypothetical protein